MIEFKCESCGARVKAPPSLAGKTGKCPKCGTLNCVPPQAQELDGNTPPITGKSKLPWILFAVAVAGLATVVFLWISERASRQNTAKTVAVAANPPKPNNAAPSVSRAATEPPKPTSVVRGGAWVTRNGGSSDLLRGLEIAVINDTLVEPAIIRDECEEKLRKLTARHERDLNEFSKEKVKNDIEQQQGRNPYRGTEELYKKWADKDAEQIAARRADVARVTASESLLSAYKHFAIAKSSWGAEESYWGTTDFYRVASTAVLQKVHANSDGKFTFSDVPPGHYYLYAVMDNSASFIEWLVPIDVAGGKEVNCDLYNENAATIHNYPH